MSHGEEPETCKFGHVFEVHDKDGTGPPNSGIRGKIKSGEVSSMEEVRDELGGGPDLLRRIMGDTYKKLKVSAGSQGTPYTISWACADKLDEDLEYSTFKTSEDIFLSPNSNLHQEFMQRKQQAEQRVNQTLGSLSDLQQQKHMLEHDIRKLRSRVEALNTGEEGEIELKADFVELVDGAGGGAQQGSEEAPLKTLRDQNLYPSIVADFYEMRGLDDLKDSEDSDFENPRLNQVPANEKAILKKKWIMYEKWKDLYGSEVKRKLKDLKGQLKNIERSMKETKNWLEPYIRDISMINPEQRNLLEEGLTFYPTIQGTASMRRDLEFVCYKPLKKTEYDFEICGSGEATHYRVILIHAVHANLAGGEQPNVPSGPSSATIMYFPAIVCKHVFENIFQDKKEEKEQKLDMMIEDYTGDFTPDQDGLRLKEGRQDKEMSVRELRENIDEEVDDDVPIEFSALIRRVEDGLEPPSTIIEQYGEEYLEAMTELLDVEIEEAKGHDGMIEAGWKEKWLDLTGKKAKDPFTIQGKGDMDPMGDLKEELKFQYYYDFKLGLGLYTMK